MSCCEDKECNDQVFPLSLEDLIPDMDLDIYDPQKDTVITHKLSDYNNKRLVLFFYPADFTFVCPTELKDLNASYHAIKDAHAELLVVSVDTVFSHKRWVETERLLQGFGIKMVSDRKGQLSTMFGIINPATGNSERGTFIISPDGIIKSIEIVTEPIGRSTEELIRKINALEFVRKNPGSVCPASWNVGLKVIKPSMKIAGNVADELD